MKKSILALTALLAFHTNVAFTAPINDLGVGETAIGIATTDFYAEHQFSDNLTIGYQNVDRDAYGKMDDIYGQFRFTDQLRGIVGNRNDLPNGGSNFYAGLSINAPLADKLNGYASYVIGGDFNEAQIGASYALAANVDFNVNYHAFDPDHRRSEDKFGFGATVKF